MARSRRQSRARGPRADWVYRGDAFDEEGALFDGAGSYSHIAATLPAAPANAIVQILYDSHNFIANAVQLPGNIPLGMSSAGRAEGHRPLIKWVQGQIMIRPSAWALGSLLGIGFRFGIFEQDPEFGAVLLAPGYAMATSGVTQTQAQDAIFANDRQWQHERRFYTAFGDGGHPALWNQRFSFRVNRRLQPHQCYGVYCEGQGGFSVTTSLTFWLRTLVSDEG